MKDPVYEEFIDRLRAESDIVSIIADYAPLKKRGKNYWGCCPFHHEKTPSFSVAPEKGFFYCFGCQTGGDVFQFLMKVENIGFIDAVKRLAQKLNISLPEREKSPREIKRNQEMEKIYQVNSLARDFFHSCLTKTNYGLAARKYLAARGINQETIDQFQLGFAPAAWDKLSTAFLQRGVSREILLKTGLTAARTSGEGIYDRFRARIIFPICDARSRVIGFGGRVMDDSQPKYLNSPETVLFNKRHVLYGFDLAYEAIKEQRQAIVVEGYMDMIAVYRHGIRNVIASLGTAFTGEQARQLLKCKAEIIFAYDSDAAGQNATLRALATVRELGAAVRVVSLPSGKDPDEYLTKQGAEEFRELVQAATPLLDYQISRLLQENDYTSLPGKLKAVEALVPILADVDNAVEANMHISRLAQQLVVDEGALRSEVSKFVSKEKRSKWVRDSKTRQPVVAGLTNCYPANLALAERQLIRLMCEDVATIPYVEAQLPTAEIKDEQRRKIIETLYVNSGPQVSGKEPIQLVNSMSEEAGNEFSRIMLMDLQCGDVTKMVDDCVRIIHLAYLQALYEQHRLKADELERLGDSSFLQELAESKRIKDEISKLHQVL